MIAPRQLPKNLPNIPRKKPRFFFFPPTELAAETASHCTRRKKKNPYCWGEPTPAKVPEPPGQGWSRSGPGRNKMALYVLARLDGAGGDAELERSSFPAQREGFSFWGSQRGDKEENLRWFLGAGGGSLDSSTSPRHGGEGAEMREKAEFGHGRSCFPSTAPEKPSPRKTIWDYLQQREICFASSPSHIQHCSSCNLSRDLAASSAPREAQAAQPALLTLFSAPVLLARVSCPSLPIPAHLLLQPRAEGEGQVAKRQSPDPIAMEMLIQAEFKGNCSS